MSIFRQRDIVLISFPFSDLSATKVRPVVILSNDAYNQRSSDVLVCGMTSNLKPAPYSVIVRPEDVEQVGTHRHTGRIKADTVASLEQTIIVKRIARLKFVLFTEIIAQIQNLIRPQSAQQ